MRRIFMSGIGAAFVALAILPVTANAQDSTLTGAAIGAGTGALIAGPPGAVIGGVVSAVVGGGPASPRIIIARAGWMITVTVTAIGAKKASL
jgi:hypothetical protein